MADFILHFSQLERSSAARYQKLYQALREAIASGIYPAGSRLPSSRQLAQLYGFSRGTVTTVYEMLWADGYLEGRRGSGTYLSSAGASAIASVRSSKRTSGSNLPRATVPAVQPKFSAWSKAVSRYDWQFIPPVAAKNHFIPGYPDMKHFPRIEWQRCLREALRTLDYLVATPKTPPEGLELLRVALAKHLRETRGMNARAEDLVIVNGSAQAVTLLMQILVATGDRVVIENPSYGGMRRAIRVAGGECIPATVDSQGITVKDWDSRLAFVTPGFQYPTGIAMSLGRRLELLEWADRRDAIIIEDDYDCEFRRMGRPVEPLQVLDRSGRVIYIGTFSKAINLTLRVGYVWLPESCRNAFLEAKKLYEPLTSALVEQAAAAHFITQGAFARHLRRMKKIYSKKHERFCELIDRHLPNIFEWTESEIGLHRFGYWNGTDKTLRRLQKRCEDRGLFWQTAQENFLRNPRPAVVWGFSHLGEKEMAETIRTVARCL